MNKMLLGLIALIFLTSFGFADSITNYVVPSNVPLNQEVTATGIYANDLNEHPIVLCSFYILDLSGNVVYRATDQYSTSTGRFTMAGKQLTEPTTVREQTYTMHSECGTTSADANFSVSQKQDAFSIGGYSFYPQGAMYDLLYFKGDNSVMLFFLFIIIMFFVCIIVIWLGNFFG